MSGKNGISTLGLLLTLVCLTFPNTPGGFESAKDLLGAQDSNQKSLPLDNDKHIPGDDLPSWAKSKQRKALLHANLVKSRNDATELANLAQELKVELDAQRGKTLSPNSLMRLNRIEKLARKIREELRAY